MPHKEFTHPVPRDAIERDRPLRVLSGCVERRGNALLGASGPEPRSVRRWDGVVDPRLQRLAPLPAFPLKRRARQEAPSCSRSPEERDRGAEIATGSTGPMNCAPKVVEFRAQALQLFAWRRAATHNVPIEALEQRQHDL